MSDNRNLAITIILSTMILFAWQYLYEAPRQKAFEEAHKTTKIQAHKVEEVVELQDRNKIITAEQRVAIASGKLNGSINLKGARFDDLSLAQYDTSLDKDSKKVILLSPSHALDAYFAEFGWISNDKNVDMPNSSTIWHANKSTLKPNETVRLSWTNPQNIAFHIDVTMDDNYMFKVTQEIENSSGMDVNIAPYGLVNKLYVEDHKAFSILHEGPIGVFNDKLDETSYSSLKEDRRKVFKDVKGGWAGVTDKYWFTAIIPPSKTEKFDSNFTYVDQQGHAKYQVDVLGPDSHIKIGKKHKTEFLFFAGAKEVKLLDYYTNHYNIPLFDRAIDFGWFYFLTKPMFNAIKFFYSVTGNFGIAILIITIMVKLLMFPLANKGYKSMNAIKRLQPEINRIKELYPTDRVEQNKKLMELYAKEKVNPLSGCLPLLIQIPVFFSLYKVLFVTIEMRHAPFFGWIKDLSAPDPTSIINLFGLLPWSGNFFLLGIWPILMGITMYLQQKMNPAPSDPVQAKMMKFLPIIFTFLFASFPAGLIIYWTWNNILSILQQWIIGRQKA